MEAEAIRFLFLCMDSLSYQNLFIIFLFQALDWGRREHTFKMSYSTFFSALTKLVYFYIWDEAVSEELLDLCSEALLVRMVFVSSLFLCCHLGCLFAFTCSVNLITDFA